MTSATSNGSVAFGMPVAYIWSILRYWSPYAPELLGTSTFLAKMADFVTPGSMIATRIPNGATSRASSSLAPSSAHFDATYGACAMAPNRPTTDVTLTMQPVALARIEGSTACVQRTAPQRFTFMTSRNREGGVSSTTPLVPMPALLTSTSMRPVWSSTSPTARLTLSSSATSISTSSTATCSPSAKASSLFADAPCQRRGILSSRDARRQPAQSPNWHRSQSPPRCRPLSNPPSAGSSPQA